MTYFEAETSPPIAVEYRKIYMPVTSDDEEDLTDVHFILKFQITPDQFGNLTIVMKVELNPALQQTGAMASPPIPQEYTFDKMDQCSFVYTTPEEYYIQGNITVKAITAPNGQFDNNTKNFFFDVTFGKVSDAPHAVEGLFLLMDLAAGDF